ncbi:TraR/DksA C4-type zinc finger protein [Jeongeupia wiesaeckerbachi]|uniref:TraR/DksA C4-type zinc finger protein n=1 Tax=Jeongeupia wiesaeckerbachi TaxID=3051218 RepID=UPI003D803B93
MTDVFDRASDLEQHQRDLAIAAARTQPAGASRLGCADCGESIPEQRRIKVAGCTRCIDCQQRFEALRRQFGARGPT